ncbi:unnamed protein product [Thelazia callipaeda]|uniref:FZ domain-containing protein n=1 Tax=Thelazia callipaeda TaxID=103827 RepID=A0A0N5CY03_THECL|nr:unnamed protein product [Thelazia callipaeda]
MLVVTEDFEPFDVPLKELELDTRQIISRAEECKRYQSHYRYYCKKTNIAQYNEEVRIICERYLHICSDLSPSTINHIHRQRTYWHESGLPKKQEKALVNCYTSCRETDPACVVACECIYLQWIMNMECGPGARSGALANCQRWYKKCRGIWQPVPNQIPFPQGVYYAPPTVRGTFYGYDPLSTYSTFDKPRHHGLSFYRGTQTTLVNWPEGEISGGTTFDVPIVGIDGIYNAYDVGFPNMASIYRLIMPYNHGLNRGTGRRHLQNY